MTSFFSLVGGLALGLISGYGPRWLDALLILFFDSIRAFPTVLFALAVVTILGPSLATIILIITIFNIPVYARIVRTQTLSLRTTEFILADLFRLVCFRRHEVGFAWTKKIVTPEERRFTFAVRVVVFERESLLRRIERPPNARSIARKL